MDFNIRAGMRVLYKQGNSNWMIGNLMEGEAKVSSVGLFLPIIPLGVNPEEEYHYAEINQIYFDAVELNQWVKDYPKYYMTKEDYIKFIESDEFEKQRENAYFTDGEYAYYPVSKYSKAWIEKQPFEYVVRSD